MIRTKDKIKQRATGLFNNKGVKNVTLREVAKDLGISYGNVTYHFKTKNQLILDLYEDMLLETSEIIKSFTTENLFLTILQAPQTTFKISIKFLFFYVDYVEIRRNYKEVYLKAEKNNEFRKKGYLQILKQLQVQDILRKELTDDDLDYLMNLSGAMRTFFFMNLHPENFSDQDLEDRYVASVNNLIKPYLTKKGRVAYDAHLR